MPKDHSFDIVSKVNETELANAISQVQREISQRFDFRDTPVAAGDYLAGPSHVLPTSGTGRFFSGLSADSFRKRTSLIEFSPAALNKVGQNIVDFALTEGFDAHAKSVTARAQH